METGTYLGTTTEFLAAAGCPVFSIEGQARNHGFARARLRRHGNVTLRLGDSREQLARLFDGPLAALLREPLFFYLDAHWNEDLPLAEELDMVFPRCQKAVIMVDDFQVPADSGYGYDDYGPGKRLAAAYIAPAVARHGLTVFYPSTPSAEETGVRRGCVVLCVKGEYADRIAASPLLRRD